MDPILQLSLLKQVIALAGKGSFPLAEGLKEHARLIEQANLDLQVPWMNPVSDSASRLRPQAKKVLALLPPIKAVPQAAAQKKRQIERALKQSHREVMGWLAWEKDGGWQCKPEMKNPGERILAVVVADGEQRQVWQVIGKITNGKVRIDGEAERGLLEGRVIFGGAPEMK